MSREPSELSWATAQTHTSETFFLQIKMSAVNGKKDEVEPNNNVNNNNKENETSVVLETNLDDTPPASDSAGGEEDNLQVSSII